MEETQRSRTSRKFYAVVLGIFALFGFFESLTAISSYFRQDDARLVARIYPSRGMFPRFFYASVGPGFEENGRTFLNTLNSFCSDEGVVKEPRLVNITFPNAESKKHYCEHVKDLVFASDRIEDAYGDTGTIFEVEIENRGNTRATGIKLPSSGVIFADAFKEYTHLKAEYDADNSSYKIPDLNPGETIRLEIWQKGTAYDHDELYDFQIPEISFDGPPVAITKYTYVSQSFYDVVSFFSLLGPVLGTILFLGICVLLGIAILLVIAILEAFFKGKPISSVFQAPKKENGESADHVAAG